MKLKVDIQSFFKDKGAKDFPIIEPKGTEVKIISDRGDVLIVESASKKFSVLKKDVE